MIGFAIGSSGLAFLQHATEASEYTLILLLFLVGIQLRNNGMTLSTLSALLGNDCRRGGGCQFINWWFNERLYSLLYLPINTALAMASGFGWYSLSGIHFTDLFGPVIGSAAFF